MAFDSNKALKSLGISSGAKANTKSQNDALIKKVAGNMTNGTRKANQQEKDDIKKSIDDYAQKIKENQEKNKTFVEKLATQPTGSYQERQNSPFFSPVATSAAANQNPTNIVKKPEERKKNETDLVGKAAEDIKKSVEVANSRKEHDEKLQKDMQAKIQNLSADEKSAFNRYIVMQSNLKNGQAPTVEQAYDKGVNDLIKKYGNDLTVMMDAYNRQQNAQNAQSLRELGAKATQFKMDDVSAQAVANMGIGNVPTDSRALAEGAAVAANLVGNASQGIENIGQGIAGMTQQALGIDGFQTLDANAGNQYTEFSKGVRQQNLDDIAKSESLNENGKKIASLLYQGESSMLDNLARGTAGGGVAGLSLGLAGLGAFGSSVSEAAENGATPTQAVANGVVNAGTEILTEMIPIDNLLKAFKHPDNKTIGAVVTILKNAASEITEEEVSLIVGTIAEAAILRGASSRNQAISEYMASGMSPQDAIAQADKDLWEEAKQTAITTAISSVGSNAASMAAGILAGNQKSETDNNAPTTQESADFINNYYGRRYDAETQIARNQEREQRTAVYEATKAMTELRNQQQQEQSLLRWNSLILPLIEWLILSRHLRSDRQIKSDRQRLSVTEKPLKGKSVTFRKKSRKQKESFPKKAKALRQESTI